MSASKEDVSLLLRSKLSKNQCLSTTIMKTIGCGNRMAIPKVRVWSSSRKRPLLNVWGGSCEDWRLFRIKWRYRGGTKIRRNAQFVWATWSYSRRRTLGGWVVSIPSATLASWKAVSFPIGVHTAGLILRVSATVRELHRLRRRI